MMREILIVGGYGEVGRRIAAELASHNPDRVVIGGRHADRANAAATALGHGVHARVVDVRDPASVRAAVENATVVLGCIDQPERHLLRAAIEAGIAYTDITPHLMSLGGSAALELLHRRAQVSGARLVLGAGLAPGISSVMARACADRIGKVDVVRTALLLGVGDAFGPASLSYLLEEIAASFERTTDGRLVRTNPFSLPSTIAFPAPVGERRAYLFPFSDQVFYPLTLGARTVEARLALDPPWLGPVVAAALRAGVRRWLRRDSARQRIASLARRLHGLRAGNDRFALVVEVAGPDGSARTSLVGHEQARATALGAALVARSLADGEVDRPGAWLAEQVIDPTRFFGRLAASGMLVS